ncbi:hypothetical protein K431DRAFT_53522 [Polychaeton citri CBS 116435]|uniref:CsbD-like domain-containing protein n=1 Tax=Polychaeton citri CBS 116435 TaxID=1314669 RepID=A0A9P4QHT9_9PEZI|nr:hypothetical protein K431DRAFT_53522 [Polychaeton citri CBS 116435]
MSDQNTSTLQSTIDKATGAAQSAFGSLTGNTTDQKAGEEKKTEAEAKDTLSHAGGNIGGVSVSSSGVAPNDPDRQAGSWNQTIGSGKEMVGNALGFEGLKQEGIRQNQEGKGQEAKGQLNDLGSGISDRVGGTLSGAVAGLTGDRAAQEKAQAKHDQGKTLQRGAEADIQKQAPQ